MAAVMAGTSDEAVKNVLRGCIEYLKMYIEESLVHMTDFSQCIFILENT